MPLPPAADLKDILQEKWKCLSQCLDTATRNTLCTLTGLVSQVQGMQREQQRRHLVFTYGTLKQGEPNHFHFLNAENGAARLLGRAVTVQKWPLIVTTKWNLPFLIWAQGHGKFVYGEIYEIDDKMLQFADGFEGHPEVYNRDRILVSLYDDANFNQSTLFPGGTQANHQGNDVTAPQQTNRPPQCMPGACAQSSGRTIECWAYFLKHIRPSMFNLPSHECYSSSKMENMEYDTNEEIESLDDIIRALDGADL